MWRTGRLDEMAACLTGQLLYFVNGFSARRDLTKRRTSRNHIGFGLPACEMPGAMWSDFICRYDYVRMGFISLSTMLQGRPTFDTGSTLFIY